MSQSIIEQIGGEQKVKDLVESFYDFVESEPEGEGLRRLHFRGHGIAHARQAQFDFLCGFFGGRRYFLEKQGHMNVKKMHEHVPISTDEAENWLLLMDKALDANQIQGDVLEQIQKAFRQVALSLRNDLGEWGIRKD